MLQKQAVKSKYEAFDENCEVSGMSLGAILRSMNVEKYQSHIDAHGLANIQSDGWYPLSKWMDFLNALKKDVNASPNFVAIGLVLASNMPPADEGLSYEQILMAHPQLYHQTHRNGYDGEYYVEKVADDHYKVTTKVPYPDDLVYGSLYGEAKRYLPEDKYFTIYYDSKNIRRAFGGEYTVIHIKISDH